MLLLEENAFYETLLFICDFSSRNVAIFLEKSCPYYVFNFILSLQ